MLRAILLPALAKILPHYPDITPEVIVDYGRANIVAQRYDAGIRPGELVAKDVIAVRVSPDLRMAVVGAPSYFTDRKRPRTPQDLTGHNCLNLRLPTHGGLYAWKFEKDGRALNVRVGGQLVFNGAGPLLQAALNGFGLAYLMQPHVSDGRLVRVLSDRCPPFSGYYLYYPSRRHFPCWWMHYGTAGDDGNYRAPGKELGRLPPSRRRLVGGCFLRHSCRRSASASRLH